MIERNERLVPGTSVQWEESGALRVKTEQKKEPLVKRVLVGSWDATKKLVSPEAHGHRILQIIDDKIVPKLNEKQRKWVEDHAEGIRDAAMLAGAGVTTAEVVAAVVAAHWGYRKLFPYRESPQELLFRTVRTIVSDHLPESEERNVLIGALGALIAGGFDPTLRDVLSHPTPATDPESILHRFRSDFFREYQKNVHNEDGSPLNLYDMNRSFLNWLEMLQSSGAPGHDQPAVRDWVRDQRVVSWHAKDRGLIKLPKLKRPETPEAIRKLIREEHKQDSRDFRRAKRRNEQAEKLKIRRKQLAVHLAAPSREELQLIPKAQRTDEWITKGEKPVPHLRRVPRRRTVVPDIERNRERHHAYLNGVSEAMVDRLDPNHREDQRRIIRDALDGLVNVEHLIEVPPGVADAFVIAMKRGNTQDVHNAIRDMMLHSARSRPWTLPDDVIVDAVNRYIGAGAPGMQRVLESYGIPRGRAKSIMRRIREQSPLHELHSMVDWPEVRAKAHIFGRPEMGDTRAVDITPGKAAYVAKPKTLQEIANYLQKFPIPAEHKVFQAVRQRVRSVLFPKKVPSSPSTRNFILGYPPEEAQASDQRIKSERRNKKIQEERSEKRRAKWPPGHEKRWKNFRLWYGMPATTEYTKRRPSWERTHRYEPDLEWLSPEQREREAHEAYLDVLGLYLAARRGEDNASRQDKTSKNSDRILTNREHKQGNTLPPGVKRYNPHPAKPAGFAVRDYQGKPYVRGSELKRKSYGKGSGARTRKMRDAIERLKQRVAAVRERRERKSKQEAKTQPEKKST